MHTKYSKGCKEKYGIAEVAEASDHLGIGGVGIADHSDHPRANVRFLQVQRREIETFGFQRKMRLGLEVAILDRDGHLSVDMKTLDRLDYIIIAEHLHTAPISSEFFNIKRKAIRWRDKYDAQNIFNLAQATLELMCAGMRACSYPAILAHPWGFFLDRQIYDPCLLDMTAALCEVAQERRIALEMPSTHLRARIAEDPEGQLYDFLKSFWHQVGKFDIHVALGSGAYQIDQVGDFPELSSTFNDFELSPNRLLRLEDIPFKETRKRQS